MACCLYKKLICVKLSWFEISLQCLNKKPWASVTDSTETPKPDGAQPQTLNSHRTEIEQIHLKQVVVRKKWIWFCKTAWNVTGVKQRFTVELEKKGRRAGWFLHRDRSAQVWVGVRLWVWGGRILSSRSYSSPQRSLQTQRWTAAQSNSN